jgi:L,D-transpeptidase catalytic domain
MHANVAIAKVAPHLGLGGAGRIGVAVLAAGLIVTAQTASVAAPARAVASVKTAAPSWESTELTPTANRLLTQYAGNLPGLAAAGQDALAQGRNEATVGAFLGRGWANRLSARLESFGHLLASNDSRQLARGVAGVQHYSGLIHSDLLLSGPPQFVMVSLQAQRLIAYDHGRTLLDTLVTTGRPTLSTDIGGMHVVSKDSPWTMKSPWPRGSPYWYPDTVVQMVAWFTKSGEGLHDASWEPASAFGPGSENGSFASHGCIHLTPGAEAILYPWLRIGTPVVVYPGDGSPVAVQVAQQSVDAFGNPLSGVRGD